MTVFIGVTTVWSEETWGELDDQPGGILYNPVQYSNAMYDCNAVPLLIALPTGITGEVEQKRVAGNILDRLSGLFISGGGGNRKYKAPDMPGLEKQQPQRHSFEATLLQEAWKRQMPVVGACRGHQMIVEALGGKIKSDTVCDHQQQKDQKTAHCIKIEKGSKLAGIIGAEDWEVNSLHCQVAESAPEGFMVSARSPEGYIEAIEAEGSAFWIGFQFHPEAMYSFDPKAKKIIEAFIRAAEDYETRQMK